MAHYFETDVLIVGGGPAGASAALSLATYSDLRVMLVENGAFDNVRIGEHVNGSLFDLLAYLKIPENRLHQNDLLCVHNRMAAWGNANVTSQYSIWTPHAENYQLDREHFDLLLLNEAVERGVTVLPRTKCVQVTQNENRTWEIQLNHRTKGDIAVKAGFLLDATGRQAGVSRQVGIPTSRHDGLMAVGMFYVIPDGAPLKQETFMESTEHGWWYCATLPDNRMTATLFTDADILQRLQLHKWPAFNGAIDETVHVKNILHRATPEHVPWTKNAFSQIGDSTARPRFMAVGDAAASFDPISAMGIGFAVSTGCRAATALMHHGMDNTEAVTAYQKSIETVFADYLKIKSGFYTKEQRWKESDFWKRRI